MVLRQLIQWVLSFVDYFFKSSSMEKCRSKIYVKWISETIPVYLNREWTVFELKEILGKKINVTPEQLHIIFAGKELTDKIRLQDYGVCEQTVLHAVPSRKIPFEEPTEESPSNHCLSFDGGDANYVTALGNSDKVHFFVFCNSPCNAMTPGKLRVRCSSCKEGTLTVKKDPTCWDDVLISNKIQGVCHRETCDGSVAEFYFKCAKHKSEAEDTAVALNLIKNNFKNVACIACTDIKNLVLVFPCEDKHVICVECFELYCLSNLNERKFIQDSTHGYTLDCAAGCPNSLILEPHHFKLIGEEQYHRYQRFATEECLLQSGGVLCPRPGCGAGILPDAECTKITCSSGGGNGCGYVFCRLCLQGYHIGPCNMQLQSEMNNGFGHAITDERAGSSRWDQDTQNTITTTTKPCPSCRTPTERNGGCMHMVCTRAQCGFHWCWVCQEEWSNECMGNHWFG